MQREFAEEVKHGLLLGGTLSAPFKLAASAPSWERPRRSGSAVQSSAKPEHPLRHTNAVVEPHPDVLHPRRDAIDRKHLPAEMPLEAPRSPETPRTQYIVQVAALALISSSAL